MPIPSIQAKVYCNLGRVISGQFADDYVQDSGLMKTRGSVDLDGIYTIEVGEKAEFAFLKDGSLSRIPRALRVLSSYADPFTKVTKVSLGCLLTYLSDVRKPPQEDAAEGEDPEAGFKIRAFNDPLGGAAIPEIYRRVVGGYITAGYMLETLLDEVGINAGAIPLQNKYTKTEEEVSGPFLDKVADLLKSECRYGYLDENEVLQSINLNNPSGSGGPVIEGEDILSVDRIGSGELPGQSVYVRYQTRRLKAPGAELFSGTGGFTFSEPEEEATVDTVDPEQLINWEVSVSESLPQRIRVEAKEGNQTFVRIFTGTSWAKIQTQYGLVAGKEVPIFKKTTQKTFAAEAAENLAQAYWEIGLVLQNRIIYTIVETEYIYDAQGSELGTVERTYEPQIAIFGKSNLPAVLSKTDYVDLADPVRRHLTRRAISTTSTIEGVQKRVNEVWETRIYHLQGQIGVYQKGKQKVTAAEVEDLFNTLLDDNLQLVTFDTETSFSGRAISEERPKQVERAAGYLRQKAGKSGKNAAAERTVTTLAFGSAESQRVIELTLPMSPDDTIEGGGSSWAVVPSVAAQRAQAYGRLQNRMRLGHREGLSIQIAPELMPSVPFAPIYVKAAGLTGQYRVNGSSWTFDANGIVCSIDAMFWGGAGQE